MIAKEQIEAWKEKYGTVITAKADGYVAYFRKPNRKELSYALSLMQQDKRLEQIEHFVNSCFLGGDNIFLTDTEYMLGCAPIMEKMLQIKNVEVGEE